MLQITEGKLVSPRINANRELVFSVRIKSEDYTPEIWNQVCDLVDAGTPMAIVMQEFQPDPYTPKFKPLDLGAKRQRLGLLMEEYAKKQHTDIKTIVESLYKKYNITSRKDLSEQELDEEIKIYQVGLEWD